MAPTPTSRIPGFTPRSLETVFEEAPAVAKSPWWGKLGVRGGDTPEFVSSIKQGLRSAVASGADDALVLGARAVNPNISGSGFNPTVIPDGNDAGAAQKMMAPAAAGAAAATAMGAAHHVQKNKEAAGEAHAVFKAADPVVNAAETALNYTLPVDLAVNMALPAAGWVAGKAGFDGVRKTLRKPHDYMNPDLTEKEIAAGKRTLGTKVNDGMMLGFAALSAYGLAKGFSENLSALKHMYADVKGVPVETVSTMTVLTAKMPAALSEARSHLLTEHVSRGAIQALGIGMMIRTMRKPTTGMWGQMAPFLLPQAASMGVDMLMGESALPVYAGFSNAFKSGQAIPKEAYAEFLFVSSKELKNHGIVGKQVALEIGTKYAEAKLSPADMLKRMESGQFKTDIQDLLKNAEAARAARIAQREAEKKAHAANPHAATHAHDHPAEKGKMVDKIQGKKQEQRPVVGEFTKKVSGENQALAHDLH